MNNDDLVVEGIKKFTKGVEGGKEVIYEFICLQTKLFRGKFFFHLNCVTFWGYTTHPYNLSQGCAYEDTGSIDNQDSHNRLIYRESMKWLDENLTICFLQDLC
jgi:hypothetical protein